MRYKTVVNFLPTAHDYTNLLTLLDKAEQIASQYQGGYSGPFLSAQEFHQALRESLNKLKEGDKSQMDTIYLWFAPTYCWDDFIGYEGIALGDEIFSLVSKFIKSDET